MSNLSLVVDNTNENSKIDDKASVFELLEDFNETKVEPQNFTRRSLLLEDEECLSYL